MMQTNQHSSFYLSRPAIILASVTGTVSFLSSVTIVYIIVKSKDYSQYHRIMLFMSFWDMLTSFSIALTSLPMPKDDVVYDVEGPTLGTKGTCEMQAFVIMAGISNIIGTNTYLTIYYLCKIKYQMDDNVFRKRRADPIFLICNTCISFLIPIEGLLSNSLGPTYREPYCMVKAYPAVGCRNEECGFFYAERKKNTAVSVRRGVLIFAVITQGKYSARHINFATSEKLFASSI